MHKNVIIGSGIAGLMSAYHLLKKGEKVVIISKNTNTYRMSSLGNAGLISPFGKGPFSDASIIKQMIGLYAVGNAPFGLGSRVSYKTLQWFLRFFASSKAEYIGRTKQLWQEYGPYALELYSQLAQELEDFNFHDDGLCFLFNTAEQHIYQDKITHINAEDPNWDNHQHLATFDDITEVFPLASKNVCGGIIVRRNGWLNPDAFMTHFKKYLQHKGVVFIEDEVTNVARRDDNWEITSPNTTLLARNLVMATGAYLTLLKNITRNLMLIPVKGYHIDLEIDPDLVPKISTILNGAFTVMTPQQSFIRLTSRLEFNAKLYNTPKVSAKKIQAIISGTHGYAKDFDKKIIDVWAGFRPLTPNDLPLFGRDNVYENLFYANGLGWQGNSFAPIVGKAIAELICGEKANEQVESVMKFSGLVHPR